MNINGTYKINIEMSARKQVDGLLSTTNRLMGNVSEASVPDPPDKENHIKEVIKFMNENKEIIDSVSITIADDLITIRSSEGEEISKIERKEEEDQNHIKIYHSNEESGRDYWRLTISEPYLFIESEDELSEYVFEKI